MNKITCPFCHKSEFRADLNSEKHTLILNCNFCEGGKFEFFLKYKPEDTPSRYILKQNRFNILKLQKWRCNTCNCKLKYDLNSNWEGEVAHIDHIHPYSKRESYFRGSENINELSNLQALCPKCNREKGIKEK